MAFKWLSAGRKLVLKARRSTNTAAVIASFILSPKKVSPSWNNTVDARFSISKQRKLSGRSLGKQLALVMGKTTGKK